MIPDLLKGCLVEQVLRTASNLSQFCCLLPLFLGVVPLASYTHCDHVTTVFKGGRGSPKSRNVFCVGKAISYDNQRLKGERKIKFVFVAANLVQKRQSKDCKRHARDIWFYARLMLHQTSRIFLLEQTSKIGLLQETWSNILNVSLPWKCCFYFVGRSVVINVKVEVRARKWKKVFTFLCCMHTRAFARQV